MTNTELKSATDHTSNLLSDPRTNTHVGNVTLKDDCVFVISRFFLAHRLCLFIKYELCTDHPQAKQK